MDEAPIFASVVRDLQVPYHDAPASSTAWDAEPAAAPTEAHLLARPDRFNRRWRSRFPEN